jgi:8-oxo-dGTP diphosphatase
MQIRQIFNAYDRGSNVSDYRPHFCPACGRNLDDQAKEPDLRLRCPECRWTYYRNPSPGVISIIKKDDRILLGKRAASSFAAGKWCIPGGFMEFEEDFLSTAAREVYEETGLTVELEAILNVVSNFLSPELHTLVIVMLAKVTGGNAVPGDDIVELKWFSKNDALPEMAFEADRHVIEKYWNTDLRGLSVDPGYKRYRNKKEKGTR